MWQIYTLTCLIIAVNGCDIPPRMWCDSLETAKQCQVVEQCAKSVWKVNEVSPEPVKLTLYMESLCPDCKNFIKEQLFPVWAQLSNIIDLELVPYGNAMERKKGDMWEFDCQHGKEECIGNLIETCAIHISNNVTRWFPFIHCIEIAEDLPKASAIRCAQMYKIDYSAVQKCMASDKGNLLEHQMALKTNALSPPHKYVPWVTLNGVHTESMEKEAESNLLKLVCDTYKGPTPKACSQLEDLESLSRCYRD
ncbi:unnamed protein product [Owenia fusiformis]|uniref:Uncharacterized protein n=1 Tax=Owenia fusiformis TaxID=6347 RepID=A0A8J1Y0C0_OWEFU|nr:unnamed protein product [Owenia fusiformis]